jgi:hypothetical protein
VADAGRLPFASGSIAVVVASLVHTDVDDWAGMAREVARILRKSPARGRFVYVGTHPASSDRSPAGTATC